jgi:hypothetical protein
MRRLEGLLKVLAGSFKSVWPGEVDGGQSCQDQIFLGLLLAKGLHLGLLLLQLLISPQEGIQLVTHLLGIQDGPGSRKIAYFKVLLRQLQPLGVDGKFGEGLGQADDLLLEVNESLARLIPLFADAQQIALEIFIVGIFRNLLLRLNKSCL